MMLIVLDNNPILAGRNVPDKLKFKQLLELCQMICSCGYCDIYKKIPQGKEIQNWIKRNPSWIKTYATSLFAWCLDHIKMQDETMFKIFNIIASIKEDCNINGTVETAIFRFSKEYKNTNCKSDTELQIDEAISEYKKYIEWKGYKND